MKDEFGVCVGFRTGNIDRNINQEYLIQPRRQVSVHYGLNSNFFASILNSFLISHVIADYAINTTVFFSYGCAHQNRSVLVSNALLNHAPEKQINIE